ncbi:PAAR domain-containing protein [Tropicimonas sp. IMCC34011]|uniref:PAAR domain-containing protein n=1 Tax=Tropicimonas sp. IMCC34011 TaxID=2248759 RepID=UPI0018E4ECB4|nr:PAAR domain-containing protein [Tropicimonas sp. IMCC34011]
MLNFPAARMTDTHVCALCPAPAGPILPPCCPTVLTAKLPQARMTDRLLCIPPLPTGSDVIIFGSPTVLVGKLPAARMFDPVVKLGVIAKGEPTVLIGVMGISFPGTLGLLSTWMLRQLRDIVLKKLETFEDDDDDFEIEIFKNDWLKIGSVKWTSEAKAEGWLGKFSGKFEFVWVELDGVGHVDVPFIGGVGVAGKYQAVPVEVSLKGGIVHGADIEGKAGIAGAKGTAGGFIGSDPNNPAYEVGVAGNFLQAEAHGQGVLGEGGYYTGIGARGKAAAEVASGDVYEERNVFVTEDTTVSERAKASGALGTAGGEVGGWAVQNKETGRVHTGGTGELKVGAGIGVSGDVSAGKPYTDRGNRPI